MTQNNKDNNNKGERIAKVIARAGVCSRRDAEKLIAEGKVSLNGKQLNTPATLVTDNDEIVVKGKPLPAKERTRLYLYHKPSGRVTTTKDEKDRPTIFQALPQDMPRVISVGRLDITTEGLLLLTNDGELSRYLEHPQTGWKRHYRVRAHGKVKPEQLEKLKRGLYYEGVKYGPIEAKLEREQGTNCWIEVSIKEGKNREVRKVMESMGLTVNRLIRTSYGPFQLGNMERGQVIEVSTKNMKDQIEGYFNPKPTS